MRALAVLPLFVVALALASAARAQGDAPPGAPPAPAPAPVDVAPTPEPLAPETPDVPVVPVVPPKTPAPDAKPPGAQVPAPDARASDGCGVLPGALGGLAAFGGTAAVGGLLFCVGGMMASIPVESNSDNCAEACVEAAAAAFMVLIGAIIAVGGIIALGPIAAVAGTIGAAVGSAGAGRKVWPSVAGGSLGILLSLAGIGIATWGLVDSPTIPFLAGQAFNQGDERHVAMVGGVVLSAASGLVAIGGAIAADAVWGGPDTP